MVKTQAIFLTLIVLCAALACNAQEHIAYVADPTASVGQALDAAAPTVAPSPAPGEIPLSPPAAVEPLKITGSGQRVSLSVDGQSSCQAEVQLTLVVQADGAAQLTAIGPGFVDHINCTPSDPANQEATYLNGTASPTDETVTFSACNFGGFSAQGVLSYAGGRLSGEAACLFLQGERAGQVDVQLTIP
jgi:hypothetical protein